MVFPATLVAIILKVFHLGAFWNYFFLMTGLVFTILALIFVFVAAYLPDKEN